ncbi:MAG: NADH-quinone oxidoreductase subunit M [Burkholderiales bacterium]|jgi:NADH-quinone oxidoreductase subunit M|nr:NADH-quinone oxidoreductase subunit M [Burkholderiales bacterium]
MNAASWMNLSLLIWFPIITGIATYLLRHVANGVISRSVANIAATFMLFAVACLLYSFDTTIAAMQFSQRIPWIPSFGIEYTLGVDGLSVLFIAFNALITFLVIVTRKPNANNAYIAALLVTSGLIYGAFTALDGVLFYVFFETMLIPIYLTIGIWGGVNRKYAATKFFLFTLFGSLFMLLALFYLYGVSGSFSIKDWHILPLNIDAQILLFIGFLLAFAVKTPMWPLHSWAPDAYSEGPTGAIVLLSSTKIGAYAFLRLLLPIAPDAVNQLAPWMIILSLIAVIYFGIIALTQSDLKRLITYSSVAHMGMVTLGFFLLGDVALKGAVILMLSNALAAAALFLCAGALSDRMGSCRIIDYQGIVNVMPWLATLFVFFAMANVALPGTSGFVGELLVIFGAVEYHLGVGLLTATVLVIGAAYTLWLVKRVVFGAIGNSQIAAMKDLNHRERFGMVVLAVVMLVMGIYPQPFLALIDVSVTDLLAHLARTKL